MVLRRYRNLCAIAMVATYTYSNFLKYNVNYNITESLLLNIRLIPDGCLWRDNFTTKV